MGWGNRSHGEWCCNCGEMLTEVVFDGWSPRMPGVGQMAGHVRLTVGGEVQGGTGCSEGCVIQLIDRIRLGYDCSAFHRWLDETRS